MNTRITTVFVITGVIAAILLFAAGPLVATHQAWALGGFMGGFIPGLNHQTIQIFDQNFGLTPGQYIVHTFTVPDDAKNIYLRGSVSVYGGAVETITLNLYDASQCPPPDSGGIIDWRSCTGVVGYDYPSGRIDQYISHGGTFYLA